MADATELVLRFSDPYRRSSNNFIWPETGHVEAPDWDPHPIRGHGLHGWLRGEGDARAKIPWGKDNIWQVVEVDSKDIVDLGGNVKFPRGYVVYSGAKVGAVALIRSRYPNAIIMHDRITVGDHGIAITGGIGWSSSGDHGVSISGYGGLSISGDYGQSESGEHGRSESGYGGSARVGRSGSIVINGVIGQTGSIIIPNIWYIEKNGKLEKK